MAWHLMKQGKRIRCLLLDCRVPVILRMRPDGGYESIGDVYVHEIMNGETLNKESYRELEDFRIH